MPNQKLDLGKTTPILNTSTIKVALEITAAANGEVEIVTKKQLIEALDK